MSFTSNPGQQEMISLAGVQLRKSANTFYMTAQPGAGNFDTFLKNGVAYQVPASFKLVIWAQRINCSTAGTPQAAIYFSTASVVNSTAPLGNTAINFGAGGAGTGITQATVGYEVERPLYLEVAATKFVNSNAITAGLSHTILCELVAV